MAQDATGIVTRDSEGYRLELSRRLNGPIEDVWAAITDPSSSAKWFGRWESEGGVGRTIKLQLAFEEGQPWSDVLIDVCEAPRHLAISMVDDGGEWRLSVQLRAVDGATELAFTQPLSDPAGAESIGPGWEYYLDMLCAAYAGTPLPTFNEYYPAQAKYYIEQSAAAAGST
ncbi:SRPBCC family protein [Aldersonia sp. NBC_00410]|uniref:SRPBCC family protein n=1 Tax=Aldersonia sp. NBC_00410 TaxID=2975954 RepID=UPI002250EF7C|nr:SRPBCC family protein [Aldersonia sp. NBC_00410]MCX5044423.1 SRPBCC family protein [Aldersonia sp. NBC_00410]